MMENEFNDSMALSVVAAAKALSISKGLCYELIRQKKIPAIRCGERRLIVPKAALEKFLAEQTGEGAIITDDLEKQ